MKRFFRFCLLTLFTFFLLPASVFSQIQDPIADLKKALKSKPRNIELRYQLALKYIEAQDIQSALKELQTINRQKPDHLPTLQIVSAIFLNNNAVKETIDLYKKAIRHNPKNKKPAYHLSRLYRDLGMYEEGIQYFKNRLKKKRKDYHTHYLLGLMYRDSGQIEKAISHFNTSLKHKKHADTYSDLAVIYKGTGQYDKAMKLYKKALKVDPKHNFAHNNLGGLYYDQKNFKGAEKEFKYLVDNDPFPAAHYNLGNVYKHWKRYDEAMQQYKSAVKLYPDYTKAVEYWVYCAEQLKNHKEIIQGNTYLVSLDPENHRAYYSMGKSYMDVEDYDKAIPAFKKAMEINNKFEYYGNSLLQSYWKGGHYFEAAKFYIKRWYSYY